MTPWSSALFLRRELALAAMLGYVSTVAALVAQRAPASSGFVEVFVPRLGPAQVKLSVPCLVRVDGEPCGDHFGLVVCVLVRLIVGVIRALDSRLVSRAGAPDAGLGARRVRGGATHESSA